MSNQDGYAAIETRHALSTHDRECEATVLAALLSHRQQFKGSVRELYDALSAQTPIQAGTHEFLLDDATRLARAAAARGGEVRLDIYEGMHHVFQRALGLDAAAAFARRHG
ncbi:alpha/beta hydrolase fold domain-containing protein [Burkholderia plantarii]|uniref:alpha/beta hydrolase fold domain-containing protein n=1 Tax=Burkholderia plantarii TaxID=41899 RepID=UPI001F5B01BD|nr:alpha/beta hydrolase fold domain-containing protein [Burkholderia plantarii]